MLEVHVYYMININRDTLPSTSVGCLESLMTAVGFALAGVTVSEVAVTSIGFATSLASLPYKQEHFLVQSGMSKA